jgi:hypothetical protein
MKFGRSRTFQQLPWASPDQPVFRLTRDRLRLQDFHLDQIEVLRLTGVAKRSLGESQFAVFGVADQANPSSAIGAQAGYAPLGSFSGIGETDQV